MFCILYLLPGCVYPADALFSDSLDRQDKYIVLDIYICCGINYDIKCHMSTSSSFTLRLLETVVSYNVVLVLLIIVLRNLFIK